MPEELESLTTEDGKVVRPGDRAFNYYDGEWVTVGRIDSDGWADCTHPDGRIKGLNGQRLASYDPRGSVDPEAGRS